jgi:hypothetical protein
MMTIDHSETMAYLHCAMGLTSFSSKILAAFRLIDGEDGDASKGYIFNDSGVLGGEMKLLPERPQAENTAL